MVFFCNLHIHSTTMSKTRQLAAIMFTDIVGYTALMGKDTDKALEFAEHRHGDSEAIG